MIVKSEDRLDHGQPNETKDKHRTHNTTVPFEKFLLKPYYFIPRFYRNNFLWKNLRKFHAKSYLKYLHLTKAIQESKRIVCCVVQI